MFLPRFFFYLLRFHWYTILCSDFTWATLGLLHSPYYQAPPLPITVTVHQHSKMLQSHYSSLCYTFSTCPPVLCVLIIMPLKPLIPPNPSTLPISFPISNSKPIPGFRTLLLLCSFSFCFVLYSTDNWNHLVLVFLCLAYLTEHNTL